MKTVIVGCGRAGAAVAEALDRAGHQVVIIDRQTSAFDKLETSFKGAAIRGDGTDEDVLRRAGTEGADLLLALTEGDNRNIMAAQLAAEALGVRRVVAKVNDPVRAEAYAALGVATICRTDLMLDAILGFVGLATVPIRGIREATGHHPGGDHDVGAGLAGPDALPGPAVAEGTGPAGGLAVAAGTVAAGGLAGAAGTGLAGGTGPAGATTTTPREA